MTVSDAATCSARVRCMDPPPAAATCSKASHRLRTHAQPRSAADLSVQLPRPLRRGAPRRSRSPARARSRTAARCCDTWPASAGVPATATRHRSARPARAGMPATGPCGRMDVLLVKEAQEFHLTEEQTLTTVALPVRSTAVLATPPGGAADTAPLPDALAAFPLQWQQICAGAPHPPAPLLNPCPAVCPAVAARRRCQAGLHRCALGSPRMPA